MLMVGRRVIRIRGTLNFTRSAKAESLQGNNMEQVPVRPTSDASLNVPRTQKVPHPVWTIIGAVAAVAGVVVALPTLLQHPDRSPYVASPDRSASPTWAAPSTQPSSPDQATSSPTLAMNAAPTPYPRPTNIGPLPHTGQVTSEPGDTSGDLRVGGGTWLDFDVRPPLQQGTQPGAPPTTVDVKVGPDNIYPENAARIWQTDSPTTCPQQAASNGQTGFQTQIVLAQRLQPTAGSLVFICLVTTTRNVASLTITSVNNNAYAPYRIGYAL
jgi:hypothetical protein